MGRHHGPYPGIDGRAKRNQGAGRQRGGIIEDRGQTGMRIDSGVPVPGKVFGAGRDALALQALDEGRDMGRNPGRPIPEGAHANHRVQRLDVDVGDRREIQVDSGLVEITADRGGHVAGQREVIDLAQGQVAWIGAARPGLQTGDVAALLVDRNHRVGAALMELGAQPGDLLGRADVSREQHHTA